jgi:hypothetical protein
VGEAADEEAYREVISSMLDVRCWMFAFQPQTNIDHPTLNIEHRSTERMVKSR